MSLNHEANGARHISAEASAVVRRRDDDALEELIRSIQAGTASPFFEEKPNRLAQSDPLAASPASIQTGQGRHLSSPLSSHQSILHSGDDLAAHLKGVAEGLELSRQAWSSLQDYLVRLDARTRHADALDTETWELQGATARLEHLHDRASKELERKSRELSIASATIADLKVELDRARQAIAEADRHANQREARFLKANVEVERLGRNLARVSEQLADEIMARQAAERAREDVASRLAGLEQAAMLLHAKVADYQLLNEQLTGKLSRQMAVQQDLQARLSTAEHERGVLNDCAAAAQERAAGFERELRSLQRRTTTLLVDHAVVRAPTSHVGDGAGEAAEYWRRASQAEIAKLREERDAARKDYAAVRVQLADLRLRGMTDELTHARCRDENRELQHRLETQTRQDRHSGPAADVSADLERAFDELDLLATGELSAANDGDPAGVRKAS
ncbi:hypothetical protein NKJ90_16140 [Mesorhizobium sp. M0051]|uniref:hypothetical protein n=1 Tax=unclassified Mesorhizobium TaxID=325217 RepID=UPI0003CEB723|nr:hypothetical protein [Mesorhizobium sp. LNHC252B00]ESY75450.1 hypothetical protein X743_02915 [Mesorhizobium sp. LNHC252B00]